MRRTARRRRSGPWLAALALLSVVVAAPPSPTTEAINIVPFASAFSANDNGAIFTIGNNLLTCPASAPTCAAARAGAVTGANSSNNAYSMVNLDADADPATFNSSGSDLILPAGSTVLWAGLYWGARRTGDPRSQDTTAPINQMSFGYAPNPANPTDYQGVTSTRDVRPDGRRPAPTSSSSSSPTSCAPVATAATGAPTWPPGRATTATPGGR